jgi:hypothetical protein
MPTPRDIKEFKEHKGKYAMLTKDGISNYSYKKLEHATSITVHKAQGSGYKCVCFILSEEHEIDKNLIYTAITRTRERLKILYTTGWEDRTLTANKSIGNTMINTILTGANIDSSSKHDITAIKRRLVSLLGWGYGTYSAKWTIMHSDRTLHPVWDIERLKRLNGTCGLNYTEFKKVYDEYCTLLV